MPTRNQLLELVATAANFPTAERRGQPPGRGFRATLRVMDLSTVSDNEAVFHDGAQIIRHDGLHSESAYELHGHQFVTLPARGELLATIATVNDVHFGEQRCGYIEGSDGGPVLSSLPGMDPYPEVMNAGVVAEIGALAPDAVVVKGDLTADGTEEQYRRFCEVYSGFEDRLHHVRGNHDSYGGASFAATPTQKVVLDGVVIALLDTSRAHQVNGSLDSNQLEWLEEVAESADRPVLVFGHHHVWNGESDPRSDSFFGIRPTDSERLLEVFGRHRRLSGYFAGHTHRNRVQWLEVGGGSPRLVPVVEVACVKDFPGTWAEYRVFEGGITQIHRRISTPAALRWSENCRQMYDGGYAWYAFGSLEDRCFEVCATG